MRSLRPAKTVSFEFPETAPPLPPKPSVDSPPTHSAPQRNATSAHQAAVVPTSLLPTSSTPPSPPATGTCLARFLQWLNGVPPSQENEEARLFLNLSCPQDAPPPDFPRASLYAQWEFLSKHVSAHETWSQSVLSFLASKEIQTPIRHQATDEKVGEALRQNNQKGSTVSAKTASNSRGGPDSSIYSFGLYVRWSTKARTSYPMSPAKLAALLKHVFGQNEVCFITDDLLRGQEGGSKSGYTVLGAKPTAEQHVTQPRTVDHSAFLVTIQKADRQPWRPWTKGSSEPAAKRQRTHESPTPSPTAPSTPGPVYPPPAYTYNGAPAAYPYYYAPYPSPTTAYPMPPPPPSSPSPGSTYPPPPIGPPPTVSGNGQ